METLRVQLEAVGATARKGQNQRTADATGTGIRPCLLRNVRECMVPFPGSISAKSCPAIARLCTRYALLTTEPIVRYARRVRIDYQRPQFTLSSRGSRVHDLHYKQIPSTSICEKCTNASYMFTLISPNRSLLCNYRETTVLSI